jgi:TRAP-type C4-dicarboxylate transport system substrate-binding protein
MKRQLVAAVCAAAVTGLFTTLPARAETVLRIDSWASPNHSMNDQALPNFIKMLEKASNGRITGKVSYPPKTNPATMFDRVSNGIADVVWGFHGYTPGRFVLTQAIEIPGTGGNAEDRSRAYWNIHEKHFAKANEHDGVKLLALFTHGEGAIHTKDKITTVDQINGLKIRLGGGVMGQVGKDLGVVPVSAPATKVYEFLSQGVADGVFFPVESIKSFKIEGLVKHTLRVPGGLYYGSFFLAMHQGTYDKLSAADKQAIDSIVGADLSAMIGKTWDVADAEGIAHIKASGGEVRMAEAELSSAIASKTLHIEREWIAAANAKGVDGAAVMDMLRKAVQ